jgi:hypothetical protein
MCGSSIFLVLFLVLPAILKIPPDPGSINFLTDAEFIFIILAGIWLNIFFPAVIGGVILSILVFRGTRLGKVNRMRSVFLGTVLGGSACLLICALIIYETLVLAGHGHIYTYQLQTFDWPRYLIYTLGATGIGLFFGGWTGRHVFHDMSKSLEKEELKS